MLPALRPVMHHTHGIHTVDAGYVRAGLAAVHLIVQDGRVALFDTGTRHSVPGVLAALRDLGLGAEAVQWILASHVHLDHAGGAGALLSVCPNARLVAHPKGARHLIDPARLVAGTQAVYGEQAFQALYGEVTPAPAERVIEAEDGYTIDFHGRTLRFFDTPGHARHHYCVHDSASNAIFTGDTFGISYREFDVAGRPFIFPTTTPVQFEPEALHASIDRLLSLAPEAAYLTHYGRVTGLAPLAAQLHTLIDVFVRLALDATGQGEARHEGLKLALQHCLIEAARAHGCTLPEARMKTLLAGDVELNAQGLLVWRERVTEG